MRWLDSESSERVVWAFSSELMAQWLDAYIAGRRDVAARAEFVRRPADSYGMEAFKDLVLAVPEKYPPERPGASRASH